MEVFNFSDQTGLPPVFIIQALLMGKNQIIYGLLNDFDLKQYKIGTEEGSF